MIYLWIAIGSALGGVSRYALTKALMPTSVAFPWSTIVINVIGSFIIGFFGTLTLSGSRYAVPESARLFVMVGICGGFTTFSSFSLQTLDLLRSGYWGRAAANILLSVLLCLAAVGIGHALASKMNGGTQIAQTYEEESAS